MNMIIMVLLTLFLSCSNLSSEEVSGLWHVENKIHPADKKEMNFSWGKSFMVRNDSIVIDFYDNDPTIYIGGFGSFDIKSIENKDTHYELVFDFNRGGFDVLCKINFLDEKRMWLEPIENLSIFPTGKEHIYYKFDGPDF